MRGNSNGNGNDVECTECDPPRRFKSKSGLNGHTQFKHGHLPDNRAVMPNGKQSQMYVDLTDRVDQVLDRQDDILDYLKNGSGLANGNENGNGQAIGNGNGNGNGNGYSTEPIGVTAPAKEETTFSCEDCKTDLTPGQPCCSHCGQELDWTGQSVPLELPVQMPRL